MMSMQDNIILQVKDLIKSYSGKVVVNHLSFKAYKGEIIGLLGPNGAGKTTAFYMVMGLIRPDGGSIIFNGQDITQLPIHKRAKMGMGYLAQEPSVFRHLTVEENILCILEEQNLSKKEIPERLEELLGELHLKRLRKEQASSLSGGERRRLEITRALVTRPSFLLLDEPFANIDPMAIQDVKEMVQHLSERGITVLITDHNAREIFSVVHRSYIIREGQAILSGTVDELINHPVARQSYLGESFKL
jgi:lipopolysaccharide export system ATP-binding protein